jgi:hypothetical protein
LHPNTYSSVRSVKHGSFEHSYKMKENMKKLGLILLFAGFGDIVANAQETPKKTNYPFWTISKDVQRLQFKNSIYVPSIIRTGDVPVSKGIQQLHVSRSPKRTGTVAMTGYPTWTISKGVARFQAEKNSKK